MYQKYVEEFMRAFGQPVASKPQLVNNDVAKLCMDLIREETGEVENAIWSGNIEEIAKEMADLIYVVMWAANAHGIPMDKVYSAVHRSNMTKLGDDGKPIYNDRGKVMKSPNYRAPDLSWLSRSR